MSVFWFMNTVDYIKKEIRLNFQRKFPQSSKEKKELGERLAYKMCAGLDAIYSLGLERTFISLKIDVKEIQQAYEKACLSDKVCPVVDVIYFIKDIVEGFEARQDFVELNLPFGISQITKNTELTEEVLQDVFEALLIASEKYNPYRKIAFTTYAGWWVKNAVYSYLYKKKFTFKVSPKVNQLSSKIKQYLLERERKNLPVPSLKELSSKFKQNTSKIIKALELRIDVSLHEKQITLQEEILNTLVSPISITKTNELDPYFEEESINPMAELYFGKILDKIRNEEELDPQDIQQIDDFLKINA